ncbi:MAG: IS110 family transposase, partial [Chloroflexi bacterium]|nr:IS110 family transposase [Chloroflexota bacterium]
TLYQSGKYAGRRRLSKRGSPLLRHVLYLMASSLKRYTQRFAQAYAYYRQQGRAARETLVILARKTLTMLYHLLSRLIPFQDIPVQEAHAYS